MNPLFRKAALIAASLGLLVSLYFALNPGEEQETAATTTLAETTAETAPETSTTAPTTTEPEPDPPPATTPPKPPDAVTARVTVGPDGVDSVRRFSVRQGREVALVVTSALADHIHLHGYDLIADVGPGAPATIRFTANAPGRFELELEDRGLQIAELEVRP